jgi:hypothetical protein
LIVLGPDEDFDPEHDHTYLYSWRRPWVEEFTDMEVNGRIKQPVQHAVVGEAHRIRVISIAPADPIRFHMEKDSTAVPLKALAKDGADLPPNQQWIITDRGPRLDVGETFDAEFIPEEPGTYNLVIDQWNIGWWQKWEVVPASRESH